MLNSLLERILLMLTLFFVVLVGRRWRCSECFAKDDALEARMLPFGGVENILNEVFDEWNQSSTVLLVEEVLSWHCVVFASCTRSCRVVDN